MCAVPTILSAPDLETSRVGTPPSVIFYRSLCSSSLQAGPEELVWLQRACVVLLGVLASLLAIFVDSVYGMFIMAADVVFVVLFPQLTAVLFVHFANSYGAFVGYVHSACAAPRDRPIARVVPRETCNLSVADSANENYIFAWSGSEDPMPGGPFLRSHRSVRFSSQAHRRPIVRGWAQQRPATRSFTQILTQKWTGQDFVCSPLGIMLNLTPTHQNFDAGLKKSDAALAV